MYTLVKKTVNGLLGGGELSGCGLLLFLKLFLILKGNVFCLQALLLQVMEIAKCFQ